MKWLFLFYLPISIFGQNTVGVLKLEKDKVLDGYNLFAPNDQSSIFLIDNCGRLINEWKDGPLSRAGIEQYLLPDGTLLRCKADKDVIDVPTFGAGGAGGVVERLSWDNEIIWQYIILDSIQRQHHDIHYMPNGHILAIVWDRYLMEDIVASGFDTSQFVQWELWPDKIIEIDPSTDSIVWEWKAWDHLIQDRFASLDNFGVVSQHPELIDINYQDFTFDRPDWMHTNGIDYNPELDQVLISVRNFNEVWIIDHSTTTEEAASHSGGNSGKGGDLIFRWGNPSAYKMGNVLDQKLFFQHDPEWINDPISEYHGQIIVYNNFIKTNLSLGVILMPSFDNSTSYYEFDENGVYFPKDFSLIISHPDTFLNYSTSGSNIELLSNGNFMMHAARPGFSFELSPSQEVVWEYKVPFRNGFPVEQGSILAPSDNFTFSLRRYAADFVGFDGKDLTPKEFLEINPDTLFCLESVSVAEHDSKNRDFYLGLNLNPELLILHCPDLNQEFVISDMHGRQMMNLKSDSPTTFIDIAHLPNGLYFLTKISDRQTLKFVKL